MNSAIQSFVSKGLVCLFVFLLCGCTAQVVSNKLPVTAPAATMRPTLDGLHYNLPQTVVTVSMPIKLITVTPGEHAAYAELFFPTPRFPRPTPGLKFGESNIGSDSEADPGQIYLLRGEGIGSLAQTLNLVFNEDGSVTGIKADVKNQTGDIITSSIGSLMGIAVRIASSGNSTLVAPDSIECNENVPEDPNDYFKNCIIGEYPELVKNFADLQIADRIIFLSDIIYRSSGTSGLANRNFYRALDDYVTYRDLAMGELEALNSPSTSGSGTLDMVSLNREKQKTLLRSFLGRFEEESWTASFEIRPNECDPERTSACTDTITTILLAYETASNKLCPVTLRPDTRQVGTPAPSNFMNAACDTSRIVTLEIAPESTTQPAFTLASHLSRPTKAALHYIVPNAMRAKLLVNNEIKNNVTVKVAQRGIVLAVPADLGGKGVIHDVQYYDSTGALKSYVLTSTPRVDAGAINSLSGSANAYLDARNAQNTAQENEPFNTLKRESDTLDILLKMQKACAELTDPPSSCENR